MDISKEKIVRDTNNDQAANDMTKKPASMFLIVSTIIGVLVVLAITVLPYYGVTH